jgi:hypothetical protein
MPTNHSLCDNECGNEVAHVCSCSLSLCAKCVKVHIRKGHTAIEVPAIEIVPGETSWGDEDLKDSWSETLCKKHSGMQYRYFCEVDQVLICMDCFALEHCGHKCSTIDAAFESLKSEFDQTLSASAKRIDELKVKREKVNQTSQELNSKEKHLLFQINSYFEELEKAVQFRKQQVLGQFQAEVALKRNTLQGQESSLSDYLNSVEKTRSQLQLSKDFSRRLYCVLRNSDLKAELCCQNMHKDLSLNVDCDCTFQADSSVANLISKTGLVRWRKLDPTKTLVEEGKENGQFGTGELFITVRDNEGVAWINGSEFIRVQVGSWNSTEHCQVVNLTNLEDGRVKCAFAVNVDPAASLDITVYCANARVFERTYSSIRTKFSICSQNNRSKFLSEGWREIDPNSMLLLLLLSFTI